MVTAYIALLRKEEGTVFGVSFPDFSGCVTGGDTLEEARKRAPEVLQLHIRGMKEDGEPIPVPLTLDAIMADPANSDATAFLVEVPVEPERSVRINITVPQGELSKIDQFAKTSNLSRSAFLLMAAKRAMKKSKAA